MSATTAAWLVLAAPLAGTIIIGASFRSLSGAQRRLAGHRRVAVSFVFALITLVKLQQTRAVAPRADLDAVDDRRHRRRRREARRCSSTRSRC